MLQRKVRLKMKTFFEKTYVAYQLYNFDWKAENVHALQDFQCSVEEVVASHVTK